MSCAASGSNTTWVRGNKTTDAGTTVGNTATPLRPGASLTTTKDALTNDTIIGGRQKQLDRTGNSNVEGTFPGYFANDNIDDFLEMVMLSEWIDATTDVDGSVNGGAYNKKLMIGSTLTTYDIEDQQNDKGVYQVSRGVTCSAMAFSSPVDGYATCDFTLVANEQDQATTTADADLNTAIQTIEQKDPLYEKDGTIAIGGVDSAIVQSVSFSLENNFEKFNGYGTNGAQCQIPGRVDVTGEVTMALNSTTEVNMFLDETPFDLVVEYTLAGDSMKIVIPQCRFTGASAPTVATGARIVTLPFTAGYSAIENNTLIIKSSTSL